MITSRARKCQLMTAGQAGKTQKNDPISSRRTSCASCAPTSNARPKAFRPPSKRAKHAFCLKWLQALAKRSPQRLLSNSFCVPVTHGEFCFWLIALSWKSKLKRLLANSSKTTTSQPSTKKTVTTGARPRLWSPLCSRCFLTTNTKAFFPRLTLTWSFQTRHTALSAAMRVRCLNTL